jgi:hypothetical protein
MDTQRVSGALERYQSKFIDISRTLEPIIEQNGFNNTLAGYFQCNNSNTYVSTGGNNASLIWESIYLKNATARLKKLAGGYNWTVADTYNVGLIWPSPTQTLTPCAGSDPLSLRNSGVWLLGVVQPFHLPRMARLRIQYALHSQKFLLPNNP